ncbi:MAG: retropepsin-like aspartic protease [Microcystaceae cyanobacterium]
MTFSKHYSLTRYGVNLVKVNATIGSVYKNDFQRLSLLIDTGASFTLIPKLILEDLGYNLKNPIRYQSIVTGQGKTSPLPVIQVSWFNSMGQFIENFEVIAYQLPTQLQISGVLGMDYLTQCKAVIYVHRAVIYFES